ncbi:MAG: 2-isopropylmalate synthase [Spirochaetales bacterium]|nr:2-isopropylmalate synthase [Spirochaetales bacterium]
MKTIKIFDTTLRDGEQVPGAKLNADEKIIIARQLEKLNVDVIEAGFPSSSPGDAEAVKRIAKEIKTPVITGLSRAVKSDIDILWNSVRYADRPRIHIVLGSSDIHVKNKFRTDRKAVLAMAVAAVRHAASLCPDVEYSPEDATRSDIDYLCRVVREVIWAGATVVNIADTVGWAVPQEFGQLIQTIRKRVPETEGITLSVHCHNDCGLATANTLAAIKNGADQVEVTMNGIGERAGNAALEEVVMMLATRPDYYGAKTAVRTQEITLTSRMVQEMMHIPVQPNKAIIGGNAFRHSSGIHQDGILKAKDNYEIISPEMVGAVPHEFVLTARSGRHAVRHILESAGIKIDGNEFESVFRKFIEKADVQKEVSSQEVIQLVQ